ncbi:hypothetical protein BGZ57DRAFT_743870, partial [Hyaloscypha finlandica]
RIGDTWALRWVEKQRKLGRYHVVCTKPMDYKRKDALTPELVLRYFSNLKAVKEKYDIHEGDQYNVDEIGFRVGCMRSTTKHFNNNLAPNVKIVTSENGYTDDELAYKWLWHFHHQTKSRVKGRYRLLIFD